MTDVSQRIQCRWCRAQSPTAATTCERCGAPLDVREVVSDSGWRLAPQIRDLTQIPFGASVVQLDGAVVPVAEVNLGEGDTVYFEHHLMLWKDEQVAMSVMDSPGGMKRVLAGMPFVLSVAHGPGRVSFSRDAPGELVVLPIDPGTELDLREHAMVLASGVLTYSFERIQGITMMLSAGTGMYLDRFVAQGASGVLILHGYGNVLQRELGPGETIQVEPGGFLYKDSTVTMDISTQKLSTGGGQGLQAAKGLASRGFAGLKAARSLMKGGDGAGGLLSSGGLQAAAGVITGPGMTLMRLTGPGRVGIQSMYVHSNSA
jgi:uncharacterized protein (AIM24 family)